MAVVLQFPRYDSSKEVFASNESKKSKDLFSDLSDLLGVDLNKVLIQKDADAAKQLQKKLQKDTMKIRSKYQ